MVAGKSPRALASGVTDAQIVAVDPAQQSLVLNLGSRQGAREGMPFRIVRGDQVIGNCRLLEVRELISAGMTEKLTDGIQPKVGDRVSVLAQK
jgi:cell shape-determining protein MreC